MPRFEEITMAIKEQFRALGVSESEARELVEKYPSSISAESLYTHILLMFKTLCPERSYDHARGRYKEQHDYGMTFSYADVAHWLIGDLNAVKGALASCNNLLSEADQSRLAAMAALTDSKDVLIAVLEKYPDAQKSLCDDKNLAHHAAMAPDYSCLIHLLFTQPQLCAATDQPAYLFGKSVKDYAKDRYKKAQNGALALTIRPKIIESRAGWAKLLVELKQLRDIEEDFICYAKDAYRECIEYHIPRLERLLNSDERNNALDVLIFLTQNGIEEAAAITNTCLGENMLAQGKTVKRKYDSSGNANMVSDFFNLLQKSPMDYFKEAANYGNANAFFQIGDCYHNGISVTPDLEIAFAHYYVGAKLGDAEAKAVLHISENDTPRDPHEQFLKLIYSALLNNNKLQLKKAALTEPGLMQKLALAQIHNQKIDRISRILLLKTAMNDKRNDVRLNTALNDRLIMELHLDKNPKSKIEFLLAVQSILTPEHFAHMSLFMLDGLKLKDQGSRVALLKVLSSNAQSDKISAAIAAHLKAIPEQLVTEYTHALSLVLKTFVNHLIEEETQSLSSSSSISASTNSGISYAPSAPPISIKADDVSTNSNTMSKPLDANGAVTLPTPSFANAPAHSVLFVDPRPPVTVSVSHNDQAIDSNNNLNTLPSVPQDELIADVANKSTSATPVTASAYSS